MCQHRILLNETYYYFIIAIAIIIIIISSHSLHNIAKIQIYLCKYQTDSYGFTILHGTFRRTGAFDPVQHLFNLREL